MSDKKLTPDIRFSGFDESWEEKNFGDIATAFEYGLNVAAKEYDGKNKYLRITDIDDVSRIFKCDNISSPDIDIDKCQDYRLEKDNILFARTGASVGKSYIYKETDGVVYFAGFLIRTRIKPEYNANFVFQNTLTSKYEKYIQITSQRSGQPGVNAQEYSHYPLLLPIFDEQTQIGTFFTHFDALITLNQRKYDKLISLKKSMLQKIFPRHGADVPEIRFAGFTGPWRRKKLEEICCRFYGGGTPNTSNAEFWNGTIPWIQSSDLKDGIIKNPIIHKHITHKGLNNSATQLVPANSIAIIIRVGVGKLAFIDFAYTTSQDFLSLSELKIEAKFGVYSIYVKLQKELNAVQGTSIKGITKDELLAKEIYIPNRDEQVKIGEYFCNLDCLITLQQSKIEKLKQLKKSLLEKMFV